MDPPKPKRVVPNFEAGDKVVAHGGNFEGEKGTVVSMDKGKSSKLAKLRMVVKLEKDNKKVSVPALDWKKTGIRKK